MRRFSGIGLDVAVINSVFLVNALFRLTLQIGENRIFAELVSENGSKCKSSSHCLCPGALHVTDRISQVIENKEL